MPARPLLGVRARLRAWVAGAVRRATWRATMPPPLLIDRLAAPLDDLLTLLFQDSTTCVLVADRRARLLRANDAAHRMAGSWHDLAIGQDVLGLFATADQAAIAEEIQVAVAGVASSRRFHATLARPFSPQHDPTLPLGAASPSAMVAISLVPIREADGRISGVLLRLADISVQKQLETQLAHSQKLQAVGQLAGGIAHDFNNLLTAVIGAADEILARPQGVAPGSLAQESLAPDSVATLADARQIRDSAERGAALVRQLLAFGRQQTLQPRVVWVNDAIDQISGLLRRLLGRSVRLQLDLEQPGRAVRVDPGQLDQVLVNLAVNAANAMPGGGTLTLRSGHVSLFRPLTSGPEAIPPGRYVMLAVEDTGSGIQPDILPRIFEPFFTTRRDQGGTGLGLSTVHGIVRQSDGFLAVESDPGQGTRFRIYLPRHDMPETTAPGMAKPAVVARPAMPPGRLILLVDDETAICRLTARALARQGHEVLVAESAEQALEQLDSSTLARLGLLVSDVVMPGMDGPALARHLRGLRPDLPAILVSGYADAALRAELARDALIFLPKPYKIDNLMTVIAGLLNPPPAEALVPHEAGESG